MGQPVRYSLYAFGTGGAMMYYCTECGEMFNEADTISICMEEYNGVSDLFPGSRTYRDIAVCPECKSEELEEFYCDEECEECSRYEDCTLEEKKLL